MQQLWITVGPLYKTSPPDAGLERGRQVGKGGGAQEEDVYVIHRTGVHPRRQDVDHFRSRLLGNSFRVYILPAAAVGKHCSKKLSPVHF